MDASLAQSAIVWIALGVGLASVLVCVFSSAAPVVDEEHEHGVSRDESAAVFDAESAG